MISKLKILKKEKSSKYFVENKRVTILVSQIYFCSIKCLNFFYFFYFGALTLFLFNHMYKLLIFVQSSFSQ